MKENREILKISDGKKQNILKIFTIITYVISILIYELGICNYNVEQYNFSLCRIVLYVAFLIFLIKYIDNFLKDALESLKLKSKKIIIGIYIPIMIAVLIYVAIRWVSIYRILTLTIGLLMALLFIIYISSNCIKNVIIITMTLGIACTISTNFNHPIDEKIHIMTAINISEGNLNYAEKPLNEPSFNNIIFNCDMDSFAQFYSKKYEPRPTYEWNITEESKMYYISSAPANYKPILYLPSVIGILFSKILGGSVADVYITGRLFNLIVYACMFVGILKLLPYKRKIFYIIFTNPFTLVLAASYAVDGIGIGILGLFIAYCLKLAEKDYKEIGLKQILIVAALFVLCLLVKNLAYCAIITFVFVLPIFKILKNNKKNMPVLIILMIIAIIIGGLAVVNKINSTVASGGDPRLGDTSVTGQLKFLLSSPINIIKVGFENIVSNTLLNFNWYTYLNNRDFFGPYHSQIFFLQMIFILYVCITDDREKVSKRVSIVSILTFWAVYLSTGFMAYLCFTPVGQIGVAGFQPRYLIPIFPIVFMLIGSKRKTENLNEEEQCEKDINEFLISGLITIIDLICLIRVI